MYEQGLRLSHFPLLLVYANEYTDDLFVREQPQFHCTFVVCLQLINQKSPAH